MQRLSSGLRVNSAKDDAAGLAISERMHSQIRGSDQAARNANDAISMLQTADGASSKVNDCLQRIRELAVQSINSTNSTSDRQALQAEAAQLKAEIDRVGMTTKFNGAYVFPPNRMPMVGGDAETQDLLHKLKGGWMGRVESLVSELYGITGRDNQELKINLTDFTDGAGGTAARVWSSYGSSGPGSNLRLEIDMADYATMNETEALQILAHEMVHAVMGTSESWAQLRSDTNNLWFVEGVAEFIYGADARVQGHGLAATLGDSLTAWGGTSLDYASGYVAVRALHQQIIAAGNPNGIKAVLQRIHHEAGQTLDSAIQHATAGALTLSNFLTNHSQAPTSLNLNNADTGAIGGQDADSGNSKSGMATVTPNASSSGELSSFRAVWDPIPGGHGSKNYLGFQVGANAGDYVYTRTGAMNMHALAIDRLDISTSDKATIALGQVDDALDYVNSQRGTFGAQLSRFENIIANLHTTSEKLNASRGRIIDADYAQETAQLSKTQILQQAGTAMVAQANQLPRTVLSLLT